MRPLKHAQRFDSAKVPIHLTPEDVEVLMDHYFSTFTCSDPVKITDLSLAYADHSRICCRLVGGWYSVLAPFRSVFGQVTEIESTDLLWDSYMGEDELVRRLDVATIAMRTVRPIITAKREVMSR